jgi:hypothetical protein
MEHDIGIMDIAGPAFRLSEVRDHLFNRRRRVAWLDHRRLPAHPDEPTSHRGQQPRQNATEVSGTTGDQNAGAIELVDDLVPIT